MGQTVFKTEEEAMLALRALYAGCGYLPFKMTKFEEYDLYVRNKDFLVSDSVITFTGANGRLLALKPDVTLSILKNYRQEAGSVQKVYYNENVYRPSAATHEFKEIPQMGLECMGCIDLFQIYEVVRLACQSLDALGERVLDISHMGIVSALLEQSGVSAEGKQEILTCLAQKNTRGIGDACQRYGAAPQQERGLVLLAECYGQGSKVLPQLESVCRGSAAQAAFTELSNLCALLQSSEIGRVNVDFSIISDMSYYNGIVFRGYLNGIPQGVLYGGQYDGLMQKFGFEAGGIGFAVYLDLLDGLFAPAAAYDTDAVLLYGQDDDTLGVQAAAQKLRRGGSRVLVCRQKPQKLACKNTYYYANGALRQDG